MNRRTSPASLTTVLDDHVHWLGRWQCSIMFPDKVGETNPYGPDTLIRWLSEPDQRDLLGQPIIRRLQDLHDALHDQAYELGKVSPRTRPPFEEYESFLLNFDSFVGQLRRAERLLVTAAKAGGIAALRAGKAMEVVLRELGEIMQRAEAKGQVASLAVATIDGYPDLLARLGPSAADYVVTEVVGRIGHNLRPFDDVFRLEEPYSVWFLQQAKLEDAIKAADRVCRKVNILPVEFPDGTPPAQVSISVGLVTVDYNLPAGDLVDRALAALRGALEDGPGKIAAPELDGE